MYSLHCTIIHCWSQHTAYPGHALRSNNSHVGGPFLFFCFTHFSLPPSFFTLFSPFMYNPLSYILRLSLRWHPARHTFPPAAQHIIALGPLAPLPRDSGNKPPSLSVTLWPQGTSGWHRSTSGVRRMVLRQHPVSSAHPTKHYTLLAYVRVCSSDL